jgi:hypothetical protein
VLEQVQAKRSAWGPAPAGHAYGVAVHPEYRSAVAYLVELDVSNLASPRLARAFAAVDVGIPINPKGLEAQIQGALIDGFSVMIRAGNHLDNGTIREFSYHNFGWARMDHAPHTIEVYVFPPIPRARSRAGRDPAAPASSASRPVRPRARMPTRARPGRSRTASRSSTSRADPKRGRAMPVYNLNVNGAVRTVDAPADTPLLYVLRDLLGVTGAQVRLRHRRVRRVHEPHRTATRSACASARTSTKRWCPAAQRAGRRRRQRADRHDRRAREWRGAAPGSAGVGRLDVASADSVSPDRSCARSR